MKSELYNALDLLQKKTIKYELQTLSSKLNKVHQEMNEFSLKILFVGGFSAGKSALINALIGRELLEEGQRPETAIAGELVFDTNEYIEAIIKNQSEIFDINEFNSISIEKFDYLIWHINSPELEKLESCTLVDMPGFNSGIQEHNKAILQYVGKGNAYLLVIDCEDGSIKQNMVDFIDEIQNYDDNMAIIITKTDLKIEEDIKSVERTISSNAEILFGNKVSITSTSKYDSDIQEKMEQLITSFDKKRIFIQEFSPQICNIAIRCIDALELYRKSINLDVSQFEEEILKHEKTKKELGNKLKKEKGKLERNFKNSVAPAIVADIQNALYNQVDTLVSSLKSGGNNFSMTVNNILRPVLLQSTQEYVEQSFDKFIADIDIGSNNYEESVQEISENVLKKYQEANQKIQEISRNSDKFNVMYKTITTTLSVATSVIAPWLELIIIFLPDVLKFLGKGSQENSIRNKVNDEIIPQIVNKLRPEIEKSLCLMQDEMLEQIEEQISSLIDTEKESLEKALTNKKIMTTEFEEKIVSVENDINEIRDMINHLSTL